MELERTVRSEKRVQSRERGKGHVKDEVCKKERAQLITPDIDAESYV